LSSKTTGSASLKQLRQTGNRQRDHRPTFTFNMFQSLILKYSLSSLSLLSLLFISSLWPCYPMSTQVQPLLNAQENTNPGSLPLVPCQPPLTSSQPLQPRSVPFSSPFSQPICPPGPASLDSSSINHPPIPSAGPSIPVASQAVKVRQPLFA
jgi:hypothetical protein